MEFIPWKHWKMLFNTRHGIIIPVVRNHLLRAATRECHSPEKQCNTYKCTTGLGNRLQWSKEAEKAMAPHSNTVAQKIPWMEEPGGLQSMGSLSQTRLSDFTFTFYFHALEKEMATHSSVLAWRIPGTEKPGRLQSMGSHRVGHNWSDLAAGPKKQTLHILRGAHQNVYNRGWDLL